MQKRTKTIFSQNCDNKDEWNDLNMQQLKLMTLPRKREEMYQKFKITIDTRFSKWFFSLQRSFSFFVFRFEDVPMTDQALSTCLKLASLRYVATVSHAKIFKSNTLCSLDLNAIV